MNGQLDENIYSKKYSTLKNLSLLIKDLSEKEITPELVTRVEVSNLFNIGFKTKNNYH